MVKVLSNHNLLVNWQPWRSQRNRRKPEFRASLLALCSSCLFSLSSQITVWTPYIFPQRHTPSDAFTSMQSFSVPFLLLFSSLPPDTLYGCLKSVSPIFPLEHGLYPHTVSVQWMIAVELDRLRLEIGKAVKKPLLWHVEKLQEPELRQEKERKRVVVQELPRELSRWLSDWEHSLLFQRIWVWFLAHVWWLEFQGNVSSLLACSSSWAHVYTRMERGERNENKF